MKAEWMHIRKETLVYVRKDKESKITIFPEEEKNFKDIKIKNIIDS